MNYEDVDVLAWRDETHQRVSKQSNVYRQKNPDEVWLIPPHLKSSEILGTQKSNLKRIADSTNTHMFYNETEGQIELWGARKNVESAIRQWTSIAENLLTEKQLRQRDSKVKGWAKPEKALTKKQLEKKKRREEREREESDYRGFPESQQRYSSHFYLPDHAIEPSTFVGAREEVLNPVRAQTKSYIWFEPGPNCFTASGDNLEAVEAAILRVRNLYLKLVAFRSIPMMNFPQGVYKGWIYHLIQQPKRSCLVRLSSPPDDFVKPYDLLPQVKFVILERVLDGEIETGAKKIKNNDKPVTDVNFVKNIHRNNIEKINKALGDALGVIHLFDEEIKMRIRFGHICFTDFPKDRLWPIDRLCEKVLNDSRLSSKFATCMATGNDRLKPIRDILDEKENQRWDGIPFSEYRICAIQPNNKLEYIFDVQFNQVGRDNKKPDDIRGESKIGLWNAVTNEKKVMEINMACLDYKHSWKLSIQTAKRVNNDKFKAHGIFAHKLKLSPDKNRLIYINTKDIAVSSVCEKTKYKYWWKYDYVVEITKYEHWKLNESQPTGVEIMLDDRPDDISWGVTLYKKSWDENFAHNSNLDIGEVPDWHPTDILEGESGRIEGLLEDVEEFMNDVLKDSIDGDYIEDYGEDYGEDYEE